MADLQRFSREFWDRRYSSHDHVWSGRPNLHLVAEVQGLAPGRALDVGCGEGADVLWLAQRGWTVTGTDVSPVALRKAAAHVADTAPELSGQISWREIDLFAEDMEPLGEYDLVSSQYVHMPSEVRSRARGRLTAAVAAGGHLLLVSHHPSDLEIPGLRPPEPEMFYTPEQLVEMLDGGVWEVLTASAPQREGRDRAGNPVTVRDTVLFARRR